MDNKQMNDFEKLYRQNRLLDITLEHCFNVALSDFEQIKKKCFAQSEAEWLNDIKFFPKESNKSRVIFA